MNVNLNRMRIGDKIELESGDIFEIGDCWSAGALYQIAPRGIEKPEIWTFNMHGISMEAGTPSRIVSLIEVSQPDDDKTYYIPKFNVDLLPILKVNGEEKIIMQLLELNGLEVKGNQKLEASYKHVIIAQLLKKKGRDIEVLKEEKIICDSEEDCKKKLDEMSEQFKSTNLSERDENV